jgi:DNA-binding SARP family transcriptional activator/tetratricopeptide (TPR) repeat protein
VSASRDGSPGSRARIPTGGKLDVRAQSGDNGASQRETERQSIAAEAVPPQAPLQLFALGELRLLNDGEPVLPGRRKDLVLLVYLAQRSPRTVARGELAALLWGEKNETRARQSLRQALADLRQALGERIEITAEAVRLRAGAVELDAARFAADLAADRYEEAVARWQGEFLAGVEELGGEAFHTWVTVERERLRRLLSTALERLAAGAERRGDWGAAARWAERWAEAEPLDERAHTRWLEMLRLAGRPEAAAAVHAAFHARVRHELDMEPSAEFLRLAETTNQPSAGPLHLPASPALFTPDMVGRGGAFASLLAAWEGACGGAGVTAIVQGEAGIGKTRLCEEFLRWVAESGEEALLLRSRAYEAENHLAWAAARDLFARLAEAPGLSGAPDAVLAELGRLVPAVRERFPRLPTPTGGEPGRVEPLVRVLGDVAAELPVVLFLDDFPAADEPSRRLLLSLARRLPGRVLLLLTAGPALEPLRTVPGVRRVTLQPLGVPEVETLLASMLAIEPDVRHELATRLHAEGGGNPFYTVALVSALADAGHLVPDPGGVWRLTPTPGPALPLPADVREALRARLDHLSAAAREVIGAAAVLGRRIDPEPLEALADLTAEEFCDAVEELIARRLLCVGPARGYEFTHELIRRVTYELLSPARRTLLHRRALEVLPTLPGDAETIRHALAYHRPRAGLRWAALSRPGSTLPRWHGVALAALAVAAVLLGSAWLLLPEPAPSPPPVIAIGQIHDFTDGDSAVALALPDLLATNLSRAAALQVVSTARMYELLAQGEAGPTAVTAAARSSGATALIEGALHRRPDGVLRLDLRRVDPRDGSVRGSYTVTGADAFRLVDEATLQIFAELGVVSVPLRVADVTTRSPVAARFYAEGLRAFYQGDRSAAHRLFDTALQEDSTFAMAAYYAAQSTAEDFPLHAGYLARAHALAEHTTEPQRLLIRGHWADLTNDPARLAIAETLAIRYPHDPDGHHLLGRALHWDGDFLRAITHLRRVVELDTVGLTAEQPRCRACEAYLDILSSYAMADSLEAAMRTAREWMQRVPNSAAPLQALGMLLERTDCPEEAMQLRERAFALQPSSVSETLAIRRAACHIVRGEFDRADPLLHAQARAGVPRERKYALWFLMISLRHQGRLEEALAVAREYRAMTGPSAEPGDWLPYEAITQGIVLFEMGRHREAAAIFDSLSWYPRQEWLPRRAARRRAWLLTHAATALHAAGDTAALPRLADTIRVQGALSAYARDRWLHHHVHGLLLSARGDPAGADAAFRQAVFSPTLGYTRTNLERARALMRLGRHAEAIATLRSALRGPLEASNLYVTRTELHEALAQAFAAAGQRDSAAVHYRRVVQSWAHADPLFHERREQARRWLGH